MSRTRIFLSLAAGVTILALVIIIPNVGITTPWYVVAALLVVGALQLTGILFVLRRYK